MVKFSFGFDIDFLTACVVYIDGFGHHKCRKLTMKSSEA